MGTKTLCSCRKCRLNLRSHYNHTYIHIYVHSENISNTCLFAQNRNILLGKALKLSYT